VIATTNTGDADQLSHDVEGLNVKTGDANALSGAIQTLEDNIDMKRRKPDATMQRVTRFGRWVENGAMVRGVFERLVSNERVSAEPAQCK
jgi:hypothetical protein